MNLTSLWKPEREFAGPHVLIKTDETEKVYSTVHGFRGEIDVWECKYCGKTGTLPDEPGDSTAWQKDCGDMNISTGESIRLKDHGRQVRRLMGKEIAKNRHMDYLLLIATALVIVVSIWFVV